MKPNRVLRRSAAGSGRRRGLATIEVVLALPTLCIMLAIIFTAASTGLTALDVAVTARCRAWLGRDVPWADGETLYSEGPLSPAAAIDGPDYDRFAEVVEHYFEDNPAMPAHWRADRGLLQAHASKYIPIVYPGYRGEIVDSQAQHFVLAGTWDHRQLPFEQFAQQPQHDHLEPAERLLYYGDPYHWIDLDRIGNLASFASAGLTASLGHFRDQYEQAQGDHGTEAAHKIQKIQDGIAQKMAEINELQSQLSYLYSQDPRDYAAIANVEHQLHEAEEDLEELKQALAYLQEAEKPKPEDAEES